MLVLPRLARSEDLSKVDITGPNRHVCDQQQCENEQRSHGQLLVSVERASFAGMIRLAVSPTRSTTAVPITSTSRLWNGLRAQAGSTVQPGEKVIQKMVATPAMMPASAARLPARRLKDRKSTRLNSSH